MPRSTQLSKLFSPCSAFLLAEYAEVFGIATIPWRKK